MLNDKYLFGIFLPSPVLNYFDIAFHTKTNFLLYPV